MHWLVRSHASLLLLLVVAVKLAIKLGTSIPSLMPRTVCLEQKKDQTVKKGGDTEPAAANKPLLLQGRGDTIFLDPKFVRFNVTNTTSDIAYLDHCRIEEVNANKFTNWAAPFLAHHDPLLADEKYSNSELRDIWEEETLQLLEVYASAHGHCDFARYKPTVLPERGEGIEEAARILKAVPLPKSTVARLAIVIVAYKDAEHLAALVKAVHMPHHLIVIHLERRTTREYERSVRDIASNYPNVAVVKFGSIIYKSDMVTYVNLMIMRWIVEDLGLTYDYHVNLGGATFPLYNATDLAVVLKQSEPRVHLGTMVSKRGAKICEGKANAFSLLSTRSVKRRKILNRDTMYLKHKDDKSVSNVFPRGRGNFKKFGLRPELKESCTVKSNSGNQAIFDIAAVRSLLNSKEAMELFAHFKYGCCCCVEESNWFAALTLIGRKDEAIQSGAMWQAWVEGARDMSNAVISTDPKIVYKVRDSGGGVFKLQRNVTGNDIRRELEEAKDRGHLFARKFDSNNVKSVELRNLIEDAW